MLVPDGDVEGDRGHTQEAKVISRLDLSGRWKNISYYARLVSLVCFCSVWFVWFCSVWFVWFCSVWFVCFCSVWFVWFCFVSMSPRTHLHMVRMLLFMSDINQPSLPTLFFYSSLVSISVFMALSTVYHSINSPDSSQLSCSILTVLYLPYWFFQLYASL